MTPNEVLITGEEYLVPSNTIVPVIGERHVQYFCAADISSNNDGELKPPPPPPQQQQQQQRVILVYSQQHEEPQQQPRFVMMKVTAINKNTKYRSKRTQQHQRTKKTNKRIPSTQDKEASKKKRPCRYGNSCRLHFLHGVCIFHHDDDDKDDKYMLMTTKKTKRAASRGCNFGRACKGLACTGKDCKIAR